MRELSKLALVRSSTSLAAARAHTASRQASTFMVERERKRRRSE